MSDEKDRSRVLKNKDEFGKQGSGRGSGNEDVGAREEMKHMAEKTKDQTTGSSGSNKA